MEKQSNADDGYLKTALVLGVSLQFLVEKILWIQESLVTGFECPVNRTAWVITVSWCFEPSQPQRITAGLSHHRTIGFQRRNGSVPDL